VRQGDLCRSGEDLPVDPGSLRQVFSNLLLNAAHAMPGGGRIQVRVSRAREWTGLERCGLRVTFADNRCGIAAAEPTQNHGALLYDQRNCRHGLGTCTGERHGRETSRCPGSEEQHETRPKRQRFCDISACRLDISARLLATAVNGLGGTSRASLQFERLPSFLQKNTQVEHPEPLRAFIDFLDRDYPDGASGRNELFGRLTDYSEGSLGTS
jgi:hypothetical protein